MYAHITWGKVGWGEFRIKILNHTLFCVLFFLCLLQFVQEQSDGEPLHPSKEITIMLTYVILGQKQLRQAN